jgi:23S rRNA (adenine2503-C2)-methyltransferase
MSTLPANESTLIQLLDLTRSDLRRLLSDWDQPRFRADQLYRWLYRDLVVDFGAMTNLPSSLRSRLRGEATCTPVEVLSEIASRDGRTRKGLLRLADGETIETVLMMYDQRTTVCVSTQVGCAVGCPFCATGQHGLERNLSSGEIVAQVLHYARWLSLAKSQASDDPLLLRPARVTNVVLMGMGEPLANYDATWRALQILNDRDGFALGGRSITVSTAGVVPGIDRISRERLQVGLAVSLHAPTDRMRSKLVPLNKRWPLSELMAACRRYVDRTRRRVTFEYALLQGINDSDQQAERLAKLLLHLRCHVNLIPVNRVDGSPYLPSTKERTRSFLRVLQRSGISATVRLRRGLDIEAGCGQLRRRADGLAGGGADG